MKDYFRAHFYINDEGNKIPELSHLGLQPNGEFRKLFPEYKSYTAYALVALLALTSLVTATYNHPTNPSLENKVSESFLFDQ